MVWTVRVVDVTGSTNADLVQAARDGERGPTVLVARAQTAGRGRLDRSWHSAPGASVSVSVLVAPAVPQAAWTWLPALVGLAVLDACALLGARVGTDVGAVGLKWPNDVVVVERDVDAGGGPGVDPGADPRVGAEGARTGLAKLAGILAEAVVGPDHAAVVLGVGVNLTEPDLTDPDQGGLAGARAASLSTLLGRPVDLDEVVPVLVDALRARLLGWEAAGGDAAAAGVVADYRRVCTTLGRHVRAVSPGVVRGGVAVDLAADGSLVLDGPGGLVLVTAGDVEHLR